MKTNKWVIRTVLEKLNKTPDFESHELFKKLINDYIKCNFTDLDWLFYRPTAKVSVAILDKLFPNNRASSYFICPLLCLGEWESWYWKEFLKRPEIDEIINEYLKS